MPEPLRNKGNVRDELNIINGKVTIIRRIKAIYAKTTNNFERRRVNSNGTLSTLQDDYLITDYMDVVDLKQYDASFTYNENYRFRFSQVAYYDKNKNYLSQEDVTGTSTTFTAVQGAKYVRLGLRFLEEYAVEEGPTNLQLIEHGRTNGELCILDKEVIEEYADVNLETFDNDTYIYIREYPNVEYFCRYVIKNDYLDTFATQQELQNATVELNSLIEQKQAEITLLVSRKVGKDEVISSINMTPEKAKIVSKLLKLEGYTTINGGFKIDENGNMEAVNGKFIGGEVNLTAEYDDGTPVFSIEDGSALVYMNSQGIAIENNRIASDSYAVYIQVSDTSSQISLFSVDGKSCLISPTMFDIAGSIYAQDIHAHTYDYNSRAELKENIQLFRKNALELINNSNIYQYNYKNMNDKKTIGLVIGKGYKTPEEVISDGKGINSYSMNSISWKAIQELDQKIEKLLNILKKIPILGKIIAKRWKT